jgi:putative exporter of polyketide antibiotics
MVSLLLGPLFGRRDLAAAEVGAGRVAVHPHPKAPAADATAIPVVALIAISATLAAAGLAWFHRRNLALLA